MHQIKVNRFFIVRLFRTVNMLMCSEYPKTGDIVMMEIAQAKAVGPQGPKPSTL